jgi:hypothetical protein
MAACVAADEYGTAGHGQVGLERQESEPIAVNDDPGEQSQQPGGFELQYRAGVVCIGNSTP